MGKTLITEAVISRELQRLIGADAPVPVEMRVSYNIDHEGTVMSLRAFNWKYIEFKPEALELSLDEFSDKILDELVRGQPPGAI